MDHIAFQQFQPQERKAAARCIWCGETPVHPNRAHIISRKLTVGARNAPTLRFNVCSICNARCGALEEWVLRFTPLSWLRLMLYGGAKGTSRHVPSYFFSEAIGNWIIFHLDAETRSHAVATQLIASPEPGSEVTFFTQAPHSQHEALMRQTIDAIRARTFKMDIRPTLPADFWPRLLVDDRQALLIARGEADARRFTTIAETISTTNALATQMRLGNTGTERQHFRWSRLNWLRFCAKTAFETLCLFEGGERCQGPAFALLRSFVLSDPPHEGREVVYSEGGPLTSHDAPGALVVDLTPAQAAPQNMAAILPQGDTGMHVVALYEIRGWVLASVSFAGFPPAVLVLAGPDEHLSDLFQLIYDDRTSSFDFVRLAYDSARPVIPVPVSGKSFSELAYTYGLLHL